MYNFSCLVWTKFLSCSGQ